MQGASVSSPFCTGSPINTLAEPEDLVIVCGEFNSGVQIVSQSEEHEQVFTVKKIVNHPHYNPKRVGFTKPLCSLLDTLFILFVILGRYWGRWSV